MEKEEEAHWERLLAACTFLRGEDGLLRERKWGKSICQRNKFKGDSRRSPLDSRWNGMDREEVGKRTHTQTHT
jgi:hypothetical protein